MVEGAYCCREYYCSQAGVLGQVSGRNRRNTSADHGVDEEQTPELPDDLAEFLPRLTPRPATFSGRHRSAYSPTSTAASRTA